MRKQAALHPSLQEAILNKREENVDGDFYQQAIAALKDDGYENPEPMAYKEGTIGTRLFKGGSIAEVSLADFCGVFTDIQFHSAKPTTTPKQKI